MLVLKLNTSFNVENNKYNLKLTHNLTNYSNVVNVRVIFNKQSVEKYLPKNN